MGSAASTAPQAQSAMTVTSTPSGAHAFGIRFRHPRQARQHDGATDELIAATESALAKFPGALVSTDFVRLVGGIVKGQGITDNGNVLFAHSICVDEVNHEVGDLPDLFRTAYGEAFVMGGLAGIPFIGSSGFNAYAHHVPEGGNLLIVYGPHVGISNTGEVGRYDRLHQHHTSLACGAAAGGLAEAAKLTPATFGPTDAQEGYIVEHLKPHVAAIYGAPDPQVALALVMYEIVRAYLLKIVNTHWGKGKLIMIGGVMINAPEGVRDYFLPKHIDVQQDGVAPLEVPVPKL